MCVVHKFGIFIMPLSHLKLKHACSTLAQKPLSYGCGECFDMCAYIIAVSLLLLTPS